MKTMAALAAACIVFRNPQLAIEILIYAIIIAKLTTILFKS